MHLEEAGGFHDVVKGVGTSGSRQVGRAEGGESCGAEWEGASSGPGRCLCAVGAQ